MPRNDYIRTALLTMLSVPLLAAAGNTMVSVRAEQDAALDTDFNSAFWRDARPIVADLDNYGKRVPGPATEVRSRWTDKNLYFLFKCPYKELYLKPHPATTTETNELWNWDVAEVFIGSDFQNVKRYKEFEVSPQGEWVDLDIDLTKPHHEDGWTWNSGFQVATQIDRAAKTWYAVMRIPFSALDSRPPREGAEFRINLYLSEGPPSNHIAIAWQPTMSKTFHAPEHFGLLKLGPSEPH